ncbi:MAG: stage V sporulation protein AB [Coprococcus sp.]
MLIRYVCLAIASAAGGAVIAGGYFAFISLIGVFPKLIEKVKGNRHYMLVEGCLTYGAAIANAIYVFNIRVPITLIGLSVLTLFGGIFIGCLLGALAEVLNVFPIIARRFNVRRSIPYVIIAVAVGKVIGSVIGLIMYGL